MDSELLRLTQRNLMGWVQKAREETVPIDQKLDTIMFSLAEICAALADTEAAS